MHAFCFGALRCASRLNVEEREFVRCASRLNVEEDEIVRCVRRGATPLIQIGRSSMPAGALRETIQAAPEQLASGRQAIREMHDRGLEGTQVCGRLTSLIDDVVIRVFDGVPI